VIVELHYHVRERWSCWT